MGNSDLNLGRCSVLFCSWSLGDTLLLVPTLRQLSRPIHFVGNGEVGALFAEWGLVDSYANMFSAPGVFESEWRATMMGAAYDPRLWPGTWIKYGGVNQLNLLDRVPGPAQGIIPQFGHVAHHLMDSLAILGIEAKWDGPQLPAVVDGSRSTMRVLVHPGGGSWKSPPVPLFKRVAEELRAEGFSVGVVVGNYPEDTARAKEMEWDGEIVGSHHLSRLYPEILRASVWIGGDSGLTHLAGICGLRTVAIFGPTDPGAWQPIGPRVSIVRTCTQPAYGGRVATCGPDHKCFAGVTPRRVLEEVLGQFQRAGRSGNLDEDAGAYSPPPRDERPTRQNRRLPQVRRFQPRRPPPKRPDIHPADKMARALGIRRIS